MTNGLNGVNFGNSYYNNSYGLNSFSDDFMAQNTFGANPAQYGYYNQAGYNPYAVLNTLSEDTFEPAAKSNSLGNGLLLGTLAGAGTGAGVYYFGTNPMKDGNLTKGLIDILDKSNTSEQLNKVVNAEFNAQKTQILNRHHLSLKEFEALDRLSIATNLDELSAENKRIVRRLGITTPEQAGNRLTGIRDEIANIDKERIKIDALKNINETHSLAYNQAELAKLKGIESQIKALPADAKTADLVKLVAENPKAYGVTIPADATAQEIKTAIEGHLTTNGLTTRENLLNHYSAKVQAGETKVNNITRRLSQALSDNLDDTGKALKKDAPEALKNAFKDFKIKKAGKIGAIAAGAGLLLGWIFG